MVTFQSIMAKFKNQDVVSVSEEIQVFLKDDQKVDSSEVCKIFRGLYQLMSTHENPEDSEHCSYVSDLIPTITHCLQYIQKYFTAEDLSKHKFFIILYHVIKIFIKLGFSNPALLCAECMRQLLIKSEMFADKEAYIKNLCFCFWNEALDIEKQNDFVTAFKLRCKSIELLILDDQSKVNEKILLTLKRYCHFCEKRDPVKITNFLQNMWKEIYNEDGDLEHILMLVKLLHSWMEILLKYFKNDISVFYSLLQWFSSINCNQGKLQKQNVLHICIDILKFSLKSFVLKEEESISKTKLKQFEKLLKLLKNENQLEINLFSYTFLIYYLIFISCLLPNDSSEENSSLTKQNLEFCIHMARSYLYMSSLQLPGLPFSLQMDLNLTHTAVNIIGLLLKNECDTKKTDLILMAQDFIKHCIPILKQKISSDSTQKFHFRFDYEITKLGSSVKPKRDMKSVNAIGNLGTILYNSESYAECCYFFETSCDLLLNYPLSDYSCEDVKRSTWKKQEILVYSYYLSSNYSQALQTAVHMALNHNDKFQECMKLWCKVKRAAMRAGDKKIIPCTISDVLSNMNVPVNAVTKINLLFEELKICKFERCNMHDEIIAVASKLFSLVSQDVSKAHLFVEVLSLPMSIQEKITKLLNLSAMEMCLESISLYKNHLSLNPSDSCAKLELSIAYFWLYHIRLQLLYKFTEIETEKCIDSFPEDKNDGEENDTCNITPAFPFLTISVETEVLQDLEKTFELWNEISQDSDQSWKELAEKVMDWNLLTVINVTAEVFATSVHDVKEVNCWILLHNIASILGNKEKELGSLISIINFFIRFGYLEAASYLLNHLETSISSVKDCTIEIQVLKLKYQLARSHYSLLTGKFDESLLILQDIFNDPILKKNIKSTKMIELEALQLKTMFLQIPPEIYKDVQNVNYLQGQTAITSSLEGTVLAKGLLKSVSENQNTDNYGKDWMSFKFQLLKNILKMYLQLGELNFQIGEVRFAKCYLQEGLKISQANFLTYWTSKLLMMLGQVDLLCDSPKDCSIKLNGLKYVMDESSKEKASWLFSQINKATSSELLENSESYILDNSTSLNLRHDIRQHFINNSDVLSSPVQKKKGKTLEFEVKPYTKKMKGLFSSHVIKLEIWALNCTQLLTEGELSIAESQLQKLFKVCQNLKEMCIISDILNLEKLKIPCRIMHSKEPTGFEVNLAVLALYKLALVHLLKRNFESCKSVIEQALNILNHSSENSKYFYSKFYALLQYYNTVALLKNILSLNGYSSLEHYVCPSVKCQVFTRKNPKLENLSVCQTPPRAKQLPEITVSYHPRNVDACKAPVKKEVLPINLVKDIKRIERSTNLSPLMFSSSDDDITGHSKSNDSLTANTLNLDTVKQKENVKSTYKLFRSKNSNVDEKESSEKSTYKLFRSKNSSVDIKASCDIWKYSVTTPKSKKSSKKPTWQSGELKVKSSKSRTKNKCAKTVIKTQNIPSSKLSRKCKQSCLQKSSPDSDIPENEVIMHDKIFPSPLQEQISIERTRGSAEKKIYVQNNTPDSESILSQFNDNVFEGTSDVFNSGECSQETKLHSVLDDLCEDMNSIKISSGNINDFIPAEHLKEYLNKLKDIRCLVQHIVPYPLYPNICRLIAILMLSETGDEKDTCERVKEIGFLLSQTIATTFEQTYLNNYLYSYKKEYMRKVSNLVNIRRTPISKQMDHYLNLIPRDWTILQINALPHKDWYSIKDQKQIFSKLIITQYQHNLPPITICVDSSAASSFTSSVFTDFNDILLQSTLIMKNTDCTRKWWQTRSTLDSRLKCLLNSMENSWFGCWKGLLLGTPINEMRKQQLLKSVDKLSAISNPSDKRHLQILLDSAAFLSREQLTSLICHIWNCTYMDEIYSRLYKSITEEAFFLPATERNPLILLLDKNIQALPWENIPILNGNPVSRMPSMGVLISKLLMHDNDSTFCKGIDCNKTYYVLNPSGDLIHSQETFEEKFKLQCNWKGTVACVPQSSEYLTALKEKDLFLYCGHGSGRQYLETASSSIKLECHATAILMGCSSGRLKQHGKQLEANGFPLMYLMSGSPCVVGNLWDITDKDIDRFTDKFLELFVPHYIKSPAVLTNSSNAISQARNACKLRYLVGAAPVIYGFPMFARR